MNEKTIQTNKNNFIKLIELVEKNKDLPIFPMVGESICDYINPNTDFTLCEFGEPYIMEYCYYQLYSETEMYSEYEKDEIEKDAESKNKKVEWKKGIFIPMDYPVEFS